MWDDRTDCAHEGATEHGAAAREAHLRAFRAHWESCRKGHDVPARTDIDPRRIAPLLAQTFIAERIAPGVIRLRIAGMRLSDLMGMDVRGMPLCSVIAPADRADFAMRLVDLFDGPAILRLDLHSRGGFGRPALDATMMLLPLRSDLGDVSRALGCLVAHGPVGRPTRRFGIRRAETLPLGAPATPFALIRGDARAPRPAPPARAHLRLVT